MSTDIEIILKKYKPGRREETDSSFAGNSGR